MANLMGGLQGAASGAALGPVGMAAGGLLGLFGGGGGGDQTSQNTSSNSTSSSTRSIDPRAWTEQEQGTINNAFGTIAGSNMSPEQAAQIEADVFSQLWSGGSHELVGSANQQGAQAYNQAARRGGGNTSRTGERDRASSRALSNDLGDLRNRSALQAMQARQQQEATMRANSANALNQINSLWANRLNSSDITTTGESSTETTGTTTGPDNSARDAGRALGALGADVPEWMRNLNFFGGGSPASGGSDAPAASSQGPYGAVFDAINQNVNL